MAAKYHFKVKELLERKEPADLGLEYTSVRRWEMNDVQQVDSGYEELCLVVLSGTVSYTCGKAQGEARGRDMLYIPHHEVIQLTSPDAVLMQYGTPSDLDASFVHIRFADIDANPETHKQYGNTETGCRRDVWNFIGADFNCSRLMMGLCQGDTGGWTAWPPHEHAEKREEVYVYFDMDPAFAVQCVYDDMDHPYTVAMVRDGDLVSIPKGYHPNVGCPGGQICYVYCMVSKTPGDRNFMDLTIQKEFSEVVFE